MMRSALVAVLALTHPSLYRPELAARVHTMPRAKASRPTHGDIEHLRPVAEHLVRRRGDSGSAVAWNTPRVLVGSGDSDSWRPRRDGQVTLRAWGSTRRSR